MSEEEQSHVQRAAHLCKSDLVSLMVGEFAELQGVMGRTYALHAGEPAVVADAIRDHYKPAGASDDVSPGDVGRSSGSQTGSTLWSGASASGSRRRGRRIRSRYGGRASGSCARSSRRGGGTRASP